MFLGDTYLGDWRDLSTLEHIFKPTSDAGSSSSAPVPAFAFLAAQRKTEKVTSAGKKRGSYVTTSEELKAKVAKYAAENGVSASLKHFKSAQELDLKESTVRGWVTTYQKRLDCLRNEASHVRCLCYQRNQEAGPCSLAVN